MTTEMPAIVKATFDAHPEVHTVCTEMGHAYGRCKFSGFCPMTGLPMRPGDHYRHVTVWTRTGKHLSATVAAESVSFWAFYGPSDASFSKWRRWHEDWLTEIGDLDALPAGTTIRVARPGPVQMDVKAWTKDKFDGKWHGKGYSKNTSKQLLAAFKRSTGATAFMVDLPWKPTPLTPPAE